MDIKDTTYLSNLLNAKRPRVLERYKAYEQKNALNSPSFSNMRELRYWQSVLGWCSKSVDAIADRLQFRSFKNDNFALNEIFQLNNPDTLFDSAILSALISSCCFIYISADENGFPRLQVIDGSNATGIIDPVTGLLKEGYAVLERNTEGTPVLEAHFLPNRTDFYSLGKPYMSIPNSTGYPLLVPIIYKPDEVRPFGHSRITRASMSIMQSARRTIERSEVSAEFYSFPQKYVSGLAEDAELDKFRSSITTMLTISKDEDGDKPTIGQFQQQSMTPYTEQLRMFAGLFAGETGLTLDDLGFPNDNPSSSEAIKASHENLRLIARKAQRTFGSGFLNAGFVAACLRDKYDYRREILYDTKAVWEPIFEPDASQMSGLGDAILKINQAIPGYIGREAMRTLTGIDGDEE